MASDSSMANLNGQQSVALNGEPVVKRPRESVPPDSSLRGPQEPQNKVTVVLGAQWGDEGKGKVVDLLAMDADIVCRCQVRAAASTSPFVLRPRRERVRLVERNDVMFIVQSHDLFRPGPPGCGAAKVTLAATPRVYQC